MVAATTVPGVRDEFEEVLLLQTEYTHLNTVDMERRGKLVRTEIADQLRLLLPQLTTSSGIDDLRVEGRDGTGPKTEVPWTRVYSARRSPSATIGWYLVYLFSAAGDRVYLSLNQGTTSWDGVGFVPRPYPQLEARVRWARERLGLGESPVDGWTESIQLDGVVSKLGRGYEVGNVIAREYDLDAIPTDIELAQDLLTAGSWLSTIYADTDEGLFVPGDPGPEVVDAELAIELSAGNARRRGQGFRLSTAEKKAIETRAVTVATGHLETLGYTVKDVGAKESFDLDAKRDGERLKVEVKGTTSPGEVVILTRNEVLLHLKEHPHNALAVVHSIHLDRSEDPPVASGGTLVYEQPWALDESRLVPMSYRYDTGF